jgi:hypothetical protein
VSGQQPVLLPLDAELDQFVLHDEAGSTTGRRGQGGRGGYGSSEEDEDVAEAAKADDMPQPHKMQVWRCGSTVRHTCGVLQDRRYKAWAYV